MPTRIKKDRKKAKRKKKEWLKRTTIEGTTVRTEEGQRLCEFLECFKTLQQIKPQP